MEAIDVGVLVVGGGPGGYVCATRCGQLGLDTVVVEQGPLGGTCLNVGCIPSKALIHAADAYHLLSREKHLQTMGIQVGTAVLDFADTCGWKNDVVRRLRGGVASLLKKQRVRVLEGFAYCVDGKTWVVKGKHGETEIKAKHVVLATGSVPMELKQLPFGGPVISSTGALELTEIPKSMVVVGGGYIGLELGTAFAKLGTHVTVVEAKERILPTHDPDLARPVAARMAELGMSLRVSTSAIGLADTGAGVEVQSADGTKTILPADKVLVAVGRKPQTSGFGLESLPIEMAGAFVAIDDKCRTSMHNIWAVGDLTGEPMLAHRAMAQGEMVAELIAGRKRSFDKACIPSVCFTDPEIVDVGLTPTRAAEAGIDTITGTFPFKANGRSISTQSESGFVKVVARRDDHAVIGMQAVGVGVSEFSASFALAMEMGARLEDIAATVHAHPTKGEAIQESAFGALGHPLHV